MKNSPLQLERYYLTEAHFESNDALPLTEMPELNLESVVGIARNHDDDRRFKVQLKVNIAPVSPDVVHQKGSVTFTGFFAVDPAYPLEKVQMLVDANAPAVLYGAAREMFCNLTARGPWATVTLPTKSFYKSDPKPPEQTAPAQVAAPPAANPA